MTIEEIQVLLRQITMPEYAIETKVDGRGEMYLQASYLEADVHTGQEERQWTRRWLLSPHMTKSEVVQTAFKCVLTSAEHRVREWFKYRGRSIFNPHMNCESLWSICDQRDERPK